MNRISHIVSAFTLTALVTAQANAEYDIGSSSSSNGLIEIFEDLLQQWVDFSTGPAAVGITVISIIVGGGLWAFSPRSGGLQYLARAAVVALVILNIPAVMSMFG